MVTSTCSSSSCSSFNELGSELARTLTRSATCTSSPENADRDDDIGPATVVVVHSMTLPLPTTTAPLSSFPTSTNSFPLLSPSTRSSVTFPTSFFSGTVLPIRRVAPWYAMFRVPVATAVVVVAVAFEALSRSRISRRELSGRNIDSPNLKTGSNSGVKVWTSGRILSSIDGRGSTLRDCRGCSLTRRHASGQGSMKFGEGWSFSFDLLLIATRFALPRRATISSFSLSRLGVRMERSWCLTTTVFSGVKDSDGLNNVGGDDDDSGGVNNNGDVNDRGNVKGGADKDERRVAEVRWSRVPWFAWPSEPTSLGLDARLIALRNGRGANR